MTERAYRFRHPVTVRFRDVDAVGHAHHADAFIYFEEARWAYWNQVVGPSTVEDVEYVMAEGRVRWKGRVLWPQVLSVGVRVTEIGRKHFEMAYEVRSDEGEVLITGATVQVMFDFERGKSMRVPGELRERLEAFEGSM